LPYFALHQLSLYRPLVRCLCIPKPFGESVDKDETAHVFGIRTRIKPGDQTAIRVPNKYNGPHLASDTKQGVQIVDRIPAVVGCGTGSLLLGFSPTGVPGRS